MHYEITITAQIYKNMAKNATAIERTPSIADLLRSMEVGEVKVMKLLGTTYNALLSTRTRFRKERDMDYLFITDRVNNEIEIRRTK